MAIVDPTETEMEGYDAASPKSGSTGNDFVQQIMNMMELKPVWYYVFTRAFHRNATTFGPATFLKSAFVSQRACDWRWN